MQIFRQIVLLLLLLLSFISAANVPNTDKHASTIKSESSEPSRFHEDMILLRKALTLAHPGLNRYLTEVDFEGHWISLEQLANNPDTSQLAFYVGVSKLLTEIRCEHTKAELPQTFAEQKKDRFLPFTFVIFNNRMFVENSSLASLKRGDEVLSINNQNVTSSFMQLLPFMAIDGYTDFTKISKLEDDADLLGSGFEQFFAPVVLDLDNYPQNLTVKIKSHKSGNKDILEVKTISFDKWIELRGKPYRQDFKDSVSIVLDQAQSLATLKVDTFVNYRQPVDAQALFNKLFNELEQAKIRTLIVDLRENGGGSEDAQIALMRHLYTTPFQLVDGAWLSRHKLGELKANLTSWDRTAIDIDKTQLNLQNKGYGIPLSFLGKSAQVIKPSPAHFKGNIVLLSSKHNASAAGALLSHISKQENVTIVGEYTGGNQGGTTASVMSFLKLPESGITVRIPMILNSYNIENALDGLGAIPDIFVEQTYDDWLKNSDTIYETAKTLTFKNANER